MKTSKISMNILQVIPVFNPPELYGGSQQVVYHISKELVSRGHSVTVYASDIRRVNLGKRVILSAEKINGFEVVHFRTASTFLSDKLRLIVTPKLKLALEQNGRQYDVIHVHELRGFQQITVCECAKRLKLPYVIHAHGILGMPRGVLQRLTDISYVSKILSNASIAIALTDYEGKQYMRMGVSKNRIRIVPNSIDFADYAILPPKGSFRKMFDIEDCEKIILYVGRIHESKGIDFLVQAFKIISEKLNNVRLVIIGPDDGYTTSLYRLISRLGLERRTIITGFVNKNVKLAAFIDSDVFVTPKFSGFPITFLESCLIGCPIITTSNELNWINNNIGYVSKLSSESIASAIIKLLQSEKINITFRKNSEQLIKNFDISRVICQLEKVYEEAVCLAANEDTSAC